MQQCPTCGKSPCQCLSLSDDAASACNEEIIKELRQKKSVPGSPFTFEEQEVMDLLVQAHDKFLKLQQYVPHSSAFTPHQEWTFYMNHLQDMLILRIVKRDYPNEF